MSGTKIEQSFEIRKWIQMAVDSGCNDPACVMKYIKKGKQITCPTLATIIKIMRGMGFESVRKWTRKKMA